MNDDDRYLLIFNWDFIVNYSISLGSCCFVFFLRAVARELPFFRRTFSFLRKK